jgi:hypothetical protein
MAVPRFARIKLSASRHDDGMPDAVSTDRQQVALARERTVPKAKPLRRRDVAQIDRITVANSGAGNG